MALKFTFPRKSTLRLMPYDSRTAPLYTSIRPNPGTHLPTERFDKLLKTKDVVAFNVSPGSTSRVESMHVCACSFLNPQETILDYRGVALRSSAISLYTYYQAARLLQGASLLRVESLYCALEGSLAIKPERNQSDMEGQPYPGRW